LSNIRELVTVNDDLLAYLMQIFLWKAVYCEVWGHLIYVTCFWTEDIELNTYFYNFIRKGSICFFISMAYSNSTLGTAEAKKQQHYNED